MSEKLPVISGEDLIRILKKLGYSPIRQRGSHVRLYHGTDPRKVALTVPLHKELAKGLLRKLLRDAELTPEQLRELL